MARLNRFECIGHLGQDPELNYTPAGKSVCNLSIAVNNGQKQPDGSWSDETLWVRAAVWNEAAERAAEQLHKGNLVYAEGQLDIREYVDRNDKDRYSVELKFARVMSLERRPREEPYDDSPPARREPVAAGSAPVDVDDIPF